MYGVIGANGRAGGETAKALMARGERVRVVLRRPDQAARWQRLGADTAIASIDDATAVAAAFEGLSGAFLLSPPPVAGDPMASVDRIGRALAEGVRRAGLARVVALSSIGAQHADGTGVIATLNRLESLLDGVAPSITCLRPGYFVEAWSDVAPVALEHGVLPTFLEPAQKIPMVSTLDVGRTAADLLCDGVTGKRVVELGGPDDWSAAEVAAAFTHVLGRPVTPSFVPAEQRAALLAAEGVPPGVITALLGMYDGIARGRVAREAGRPQRRGSVTLIDAVRRLVGAACA